MLEEGNMEETNQKGQWGSRFGFLMATIGSAVGLGNLWGFPYKMGKNGGFAFLIIYLVLVVCVGVIIMLCELSLGRKSGKGVISAYRSVSRKYAFVGWFGWLSPLFILGFYCMLGGWCIKYTLVNLGDMFHASWGMNGMDSLKYFSSFSSDQLQSAIFTMIFLIITILVVRSGVSGGIERFSTVAMPMLFVILAIIIVRACTLPGADAGLEFVFKPNFKVFHGTGWINVLAAAGGQMFFSLSLGMGIIVTYGSYMRKEESLEKSALIVPLADTIAAVMAAMATMPAVFAAGLDPAQGPGMLYITLQTVFSHMGTFGPLFGVLFYFLVFIAAVTSSISLAETVTSSLIDQCEERGKPISRNKAALITFIFVAAEGCFVAADGLGTAGFPQIFGQSTWLDTFDLLSEGLMMPIGAFMTALIFGWFRPNYLDDEITLNGDKFRIKGYWNFCMKFIVPPILLLVLLGQIDTFFGLHIFS